MQHDLLYMIFTVSKNIMSVKYRIKVKFNNIKHDIPH